MLSGWYYPDGIGGTESYVRSLAKGLESMGHSVTVAAPGGEDEKRYRHDGLSVYRYPAAPRPDRRQTTGQAPPQYLDDFARWLGRESPDIVHMHSFTTACGFFHAQCVKQRGIPLVYTAHVGGLTCLRGTLMRWGKIPCDGQLRPFRCALCTLWKGNTPRLLEERKKILEDFFSLVDRIVVVSKWLYENLKLNGVADSKLTLCRHGLPGQSFIASPVKTPADERVARRNGCLRIGYVGRFDRIKGVHVLIAAVKKLSSGFPLELKIYGRANSPEETGYLESLMRRAGNDGRISFLGEVNDDNRPQVFEGLDVLAVPSLCMETGPLVVLEAQAAGVPVLGSDLGGIAEWVTGGKNGLLLPAGDASAWAKAVERLARDPGELESLRKGTSLPRNMHEVVLEMAAVYEEALRRPR